MDTLINALVSNFASCLVSGLFVYLNYQIRTMQQDRKTKAEVESKARTRQEKVDLWLLRGELTRIMQYHLDIGYIPEKALAQLEEGYTLYEEMGGNGEVKIYMESIRDLPHKRS